MLKKKKILAFILVLAMLSSFGVACNKDLPDVDEEYDYNNKEDDISDNNIDNENENDNDNDNDNVSNNNNDNENNNDNDNVSNNNNDNENNGNNGTDDETSNNDNSDKGNINEGIVSKPVLDLTGVEPIRYVTLGEDYQYIIGGGNRLLKFMNEPKDSFLGVCKYYAENGYTLYGYNKMGNVLAATYTKSSLLAHIYWIGGEMNELAVVIGRGGNALPPVTPDVTTGNYDTIVTQMRAWEADVSTRINGMGYVVRLADGSFIIFDGGYATRVDELWDALTTLNGGEEGIVIRAWLLTHGHGDHTYCFRAFSEKYASKVTLERILVSPLTNEGGNYVSLIRMFKGAEILYVHTGMVLNFCDVKLEILCATDEIYFDGASDDYNNTSIVSRVYKEDGKSFMVLGDAGDDVSTRLIPMYGEYLKSDICQASHHGVEDFTVEAYRLIRSAIWFYPCNTSLYNLTNRDREIRDEIKNAEYTEKIYRHDTRVRPEVSLNH